MTNKDLKNIYRLKNIIRYNTRMKIRNESVAEHSFYVALISLMLCKEYKLSEEITSQCVIKSILHDMPEIEINDITHDAKEKLKLRDYLQQFENQYYADNFAEYYELMTKPTEVVNHIVELADALSVKQYVDSEIELGNASDEMLDILTDSNKRIAEHIHNLEKCL